GLAPIHVVPAIGMENIRQQRCAEKETHLIFGHAAFELPDLFLRQVIALLNFHSIGLERIDAAATRQSEHNNGAKGNKAHGHVGSGPAFSATRKADIIAHHRAAPGSCCRPSITPISTAFTTPRQTGAINLEARLMSNAQNLKTIGLKATLPRLKILEL